MDTRMDPQTTPAKWHELFTKAVTEGVQVRQLGSGQWVASSGTDAGTAYAVSLLGCDCLGHQHHRRCKHRALLAFRLGVLTIEAGHDAGDPGAAATRGLTSEEIVALKADALRQAVAHDLPLIDPFTGQVVDRANCPTE